MAVAKALDIPFETVRDLTVVKTETAGMPGWAAALLGAGILSGGIGLGSLLFQNLTKSELPALPATEIIEKIPRIDVDVIPPPGDGSR